MSGKKEEQLCLDFNPSFAVAPPAPRKSASTPIIPIGQKRDQANTERLRQAVLARSRHIPDRL
ncbi:MAG: hypothetical protein V2A73_16275 [Pseudomonadota bacterium]